MNVLQEAKDCLLNVGDRPLPFRVSEVWAKHQKENREAIIGLKSVEEAIHRAQSAVSGFDHRELEEQAKQTVNFKLAEMKLQFPEYEVDRELFSESEFSIPESIVTGATGRQVSSILLTHLYFYLRTTGISQPRNVLEIGSGYGGLARIFRLAGRQTYTLVDLPESLFYAHVFLRANFPNARIAYVQEKSTEWDHPDSYDFILCPAQFAERLHGQQYDLVINTGSLQEMTASAAGYWMTFIQEKIRARAFYSWNYFLNDKVKYNETQGDCSLIAPVLDPFWSVKYFRINDPALTIDCDQRNWLEVYVERIPEDTDRKVYVNQLIDNANSFRTATNYWFANMWMAIWVVPAPHIIKAMLFGIECFAKGKAPGIQNYMEDPDEEFGEERFYRVILETEEEQL